MKKLKVIHSLNNSSSGWDEIPTFLVKKCVDSFIEPLTYLENSSISEGIFPSELKLARVVSNLVTLLSSPTIDQFQC